MNGRVIYPEGSAKVSRMVWTGETFVAEYLTPEIELWTSEEMETGAPLMWTTDAADARVFPTFPLARDKALEMRGGGEAGIFAVRCGPPPIPTLEEVLALGERFFGDDTLAHVFAGDDGDVYRRTVERCEGKLHTEDQ